MVFNIVCFSGDATVGGTLKLSLDFRPSDGQCVALLEANSVTGAFETVEVTLTDPADACVDVTGQSCSCCPVGCRCRRCAQLRAGDSAPQMDAPNVIVVCVSVANPDCVVGDAVVPEPSSALPFGLEIWQLAAYVERMDIFLVF